MKVYIGNGDRADKRKMGERTEMNYKYTKEGKKVVVVGKVNDEQWIVQEVYATDEKEFPAGENFVVKTLLDEPAETYAAREERRSKERRDAVKREIEDLEKTLKTKRDLSRAHKLMNRIIERYGQIDVEELTTFVDFVSGQITHLYIHYYSDYEIVPLIDALTQKDEPYFEGLKLITLFGVNESGKRWPDEYMIKFDWRLNQYQDGSGISKSVIPCKSYAEAIEVMIAEMKNEDKVNSHMIKAREKYDLPYPSEKLIRDFYADQIHGKQKALDQALAVVDEKRKSLEHVKALAGIVDTDGQNETDREGTRK